MFWIIIGSFSLLFAYLGASKKTKKSSQRLLFRFLLIVTLAIPIAFGGPSSADHEGYARNYNYMSTRTVSELVKNYDIANSVFSQREETYEMGFTTLIILINKLGFSEASFFLIIALITSSLYVSFFYRFKLIPLVVLIFITSVYYSHQANLVRQMIAVTVFLYSTKYIVNQEFWKYVFCVIFASLFHSSALLLLLFYPVSFIRSCSKYIWNILLGFWILSLPLALHIIDINLFSIIPSVLNYTVSVEDSLQIGAVIDFDLVYNAFVLLFFFMRKNIQEGYIKYAALFVIGGILLNVSQQMTLIYRFALYFAPLMCVFVPNLTAVNVSDKGLKQGLISLRVVVVLYYSFIFLSSMVFTANPPLTREMYSITDLF